MAGTRSYLKWFLSWSLVTWYIEAIPRPDIRFEPEQPAYIEGERLTMRCVAASPSTVTGYTFYKDSAVTSNRISNNILTFNLQTSDSGMYFCIYDVENDGKSPESIVVNLKVIEKPPAPSLSVTPERNVFVEDQSAILLCQLPEGQRSAATGITLYQNRRETNSDNFGALTYTNLQIENTGNYSCGYRVSLSGRTIESYSSKEKALIVIEALPRPDIRFDPEQTAYIEGERLTMRCVAANPSTVTGYTFYKDSAVTSNRASNNILTFNLKTSDSGKYFCIYNVENGGISPESIIINLIVIEKPPAPSLSVTPERNIFVEDQSAVLRCQLPEGQRSAATGITLYQNRRETNSDNFGVLTYTNLQMENTGNYSCGYRVSLSGRTIESYSSKEKALIVIELPPTPRFRYDYSHQNMEVQITCEVQNPSFYQIHGYNFYQNGRKIKSTNQVNHVTFNYTLNSDGCYYCQTFVTVLGEEILSAKSIEHFLSVKGSDETQCLENVSKASIFSKQDLKFYGSILAGKILVLISVLAIFGVYLLVIQQRNQKPEAE